MEKTYGTFDYTKDGITLHVNWDKKDYFVSSNMNGIQLSESGHMMFMMPKFYTEKDIREKCRGLVPDFLRAYRIITENKDFFTEKEKTLVQLKAAMHKEVEALRETKRELKKQLKDGTLPKKEYDEKYAEIKLKKDASVQKIIGFITSSARAITASDSRCYSLIKSYFKEIYMQVDKDEPGMSKPSEDIVIG